MKVVLMQPYFFPYIGYFQLMHLCDKFIVFDTVQYIKKGWINRNRILHPTGMPTYINVPIKKSHSHELIKNIFINNNEDWKESILNRLEQYYKDAPYKEQILNFIKECFKEEFTSVCQLNTHLLRKTCDYLKINCQISVLSELNLDYQQAAAPDEWGLNICKALNANTYINSPGGITFFDREKYQNENIEIQFIKPILNPYNQNLEHFEPGLSIIDLMMFNSIEDIRKMLSDYDEI